MTPRTPTNNAGDSPKTFGTLDPSFLADRQADGREVVVPRGAGFGTAKPKTSAPPNPGSDPRGEKKYTPVKRESRAKSVPTPANPKR